MTVVCLYTHCQGLDKMKAETQEPLWKAAAPQTPTVGAEPVQGQPAYPTTLPMLQLARNLLRPSSG